MEKKQSIGFGFRGTMLIIFQALGFFAFAAFTMWPMNILAGEEANFFGGHGLIPKVYTSAILVGIVVQLVLSFFIGKIKSVKKLSMVFGAISLLLAIPIMSIPLTTEVNIPWLIFYVLEVIIVQSYTFLTIGILIGQWFPHRKGTVMGIATCMFPINNLLLSWFANRFFSSLAHGAKSALQAYWPFFLLALLGWMIGLIFIKDYPELCGCYRDNDARITMEQAIAKMQEEVEGKKTSVWKIGNAIRSRDFWFITLAEGLLLMFAVGMMTQTKTIIYKVFPDSTNAYAIIMFAVCVCGIIGSWGLGIFDTRFGTKKAMLLCAALMVAVGIMGSVGSPVFFVIAMGILGCFDGAASNFAVSLSAQYWRREDFPTVFSIISPLAHVLEAFGATLIATLLYNPNLGYVWDFRACIIGGTAAFILLLLFNKKHLKTVDDKFRMKAGKPLDDRLVGRK